MYPTDRQRSIAARKAFPERVVSNAKSSRIAANSSRRRSITRPAPTATASAENPESPRAITSALTNSAT